MKIFLKTISTLLAVLFVLGSFAVLPVFAADTKKEEEEEEVTVETLDYYTEVFNTPEEALEWMTLYMENDNFAFYINDYTAAFAVVNKATGQITFSNPYDVSSSVGKTATAIKNQVLSQIHIKYKENSSDLSKELYSYSDAVTSNQVKIKKIKSGVRVEYIIGNEATRKLVPRLITVERYNEMIYEPLLAALGETHNLRRFNAFYDKQDSNDPMLAVAAKAAMIKRYPISETKVIMALSSDITGVELSFAEELIKGYCPDYTFDEMERDHEECLYEAENELSPVFKLALEYSLDENGFTVRLPTNGLRYNTTLYTLENLVILPYFGAGNSYNTGYTFLPDGSGALFAFEDLAGDTPYRTARKMYGVDFAYHSLDGTYQKAFRMPVFGIKSDDTIYSYTITEMVTNEEDGTESQETKEYKVSATVLRDTKALEDELKQKKKDEDIIDYTEIVESTSSRGFLAIVEEGDSLCELCTYHAGRTSDYHTIQLSFNPRPKDSYDISDAISVSGAGERTVVSDRKYTGNLKIRYVMLTDEKLAAETEFNKTPAYYRADYVGMAAAYADYLAAQGILERLTDKDVKNDIPLYIESFGALEVTEQILSFPVDVMKPLTTFKDIEKMYDELSDAGVKNINFRLTGFANGGMYSIVPSKLKWEKAVGGKDGFIELLEYAQKKNADGSQNISLYPDFDFLYINDSSAFDGVRMKRDAIKTIDNRYTSKRYYSATQRRWTGFFQMALSPAAIDRFYNKLLGNYEDYLKYDALGISVSTMGTDLSTDFDEDEPYNREDNKKFIMAAFDAFSSAEGMKGVMTDGGNAYTLRYVDHLMNVELDSSRFMRASYSIPFVGLVLHGYLQFAGAPLNMEGDVDYAILKAIENGASLNFVLSYRNTSELKEDFMLSKYYSVNYTIWKDDVISYYNELNAALKDVQTKRIIDHQFISGTRILDVSEIEAMIRDTMEANAKFEESYEEMTKMQNIIAIAEARAAAKSAVQTLDETQVTLTENVEKMEAVTANIQKLIKTCDTKKATYESKAKDPKTSSAQLKAYLKSYNTAKNDIRDAAVDAIQMALDAEFSYQEMLKLYETAATAMELLEEAGAAEELIKAASVSVTEAETYLSTIADLATECSSYVDAIYEAASVYVEKEDIDEILDFHEEKEKEEEEETDDEDSIYVSNDGHIVAVTYGDVNGTEAVPYKTFILNYNNYAVTVTYEVGGAKKVYTIPANQYVVILY